MVFNVVTHELKSVGGGVGDCLGVKTGEGMEITILGVGANCGIANADVLTNRMAEAPNSIGVT